MRAIKRYQVNAIGATSVTLEPVPAAKGPEGQAYPQPNVFGTGNILLTQGATPDATFWKASRRYLIEISVVDG